MSARYRHLTLAIAMLLAVGFSLPVHAASSNTEGAIARLESRADALKREMRRSPKKGAATLSKLRNEIRAINEEIAHLEGGGAVDVERLADLTSRDPMLRRDADSMARRAAAKREAVERKLRTGPKLGALGRKAVLEDVERIDDLIAALESDREVDPEVLNEYLGIMISDASKSPAERIRESEVKLASLKRKLNTGPKLGSLGRARVRDEIRALDALIERLEREANR